MISSVLAAAKTTAGTKPRETSIGIWILFLIALLPTLIALYYKTTAPPERPGEGPRIIREGVDQDRRKRFEDERRSPAGIWGQGASKI